METKDILLFESGDGGEMAIINEDLALTEMLYQQVYLALFGGNVEQNTKTDYLATEERFDWWGNTLLFGTDVGAQFNSNTERTLEQIALNSSGRLALMRAIEEDLSYLNSLSNYEVEVLLESENRVKIIINFTPKQNQQDRVLILVYDNAKNELIIEQTI